MSSLVQIGLSKLLGLYGASEEDCGTGKVPQGKYGFRIGLENNYGESLAWWIRRKRKEQNNYFALSLKNDNELFARQHKLI